MSIDARVRAVIHYEDGSGRLELEDSAPGRTAGQNALHFNEAPHDVTCLNGQIIWGGSGEVMLGDRKFARRVGYGGIEFTVPNFHGWKVNELGALR